MVWSAELFTKEPGSGKIVSWHQDLTYWGLGETDEEVTAWIALSDVSRASGCMRFVPGSHRRPIVPHRGTFAMLVRGADRTRNWIHIAPTSEAFASDGLRLYD